MAGLLAIAVFGVALARTFEARVAARLDRLARPPAARTEIDRELSKMAGAELAAVSSIPPRERTAVQAAIDDAFVAAFRLVMLGAAALALAAAAAGSGLRNDRSTA